VSRSGTTRTWQSMPVIFISRALSNNLLWVGARIGVWQGGGPYGGGPGCASDASAACHTSRSRVKICPGPRRQGLC
jgi:hypothetical protein